jgi:DNA uptake protein ComE-like DNA-binding protein
MRSSALTLAVGVTLALAACSSGNETKATDSAAAATPPAATPAAASAAADSTAAANAPVGALLNPDSATRDQLMSVAGIDAALADSIIAGRPYKNMLTVDRILSKKLSEPQRDSVYARLFRPLDLNRTNGDEIMLIPGVGDKMRHEFEEYRPYKDIAQFRREIGKYVDKQELARLEKYVTVR